MALKRLLSKIFFISFMTKAIASDCQTVVTEGGTQSPTVCVFPFILGAKTYYGCTKVHDPDGVPWCSVRVDNFGIHISGKGLWGHCDCNKCDCEGTTKTTTTTIKTTTTTTTTTTPTTPTTPTTRTTRTTPPIPRFRLDSDDKAAKDPCPQGHTCTKNCAAVLQTIEAMKSFASPKALQAYKESKSCSSVTEIDLRKGDGSDAYCCKLANDDEEDNIYNGKKIQDSKLIHNVC